MLILQLIAALLVLIALYLFAHLAMRLHSGPALLILSTKRLIRQLVYGGERVAHRTLALLEMEAPTQREGIIEATRADGLSLRLVSLTAPVHTLLIHLTLPTPAPLPLSLSTPRALLRERLSADLADAGEVISAASLITALQAHEARLGLLPATLDGAQPLGDRDLDALLLARGDEAATLALLREELRAALLGLLGPRDGLRWHALRLDETGLHAWLIAPEASGQLTPMRLARPIQELARTFAIACAGLHDLPSTLLAQLARAQSPGYRERCATFLLSEHHALAQEQRVSLRCLESHQPAELRMIGLRHHPDQLDREARTRLLLDCAMAHSRAAMRDAALGQLVEEGGPAILERHDLPQFLLLRLIAAGEGRWAADQLAQRLSPHIESWTELERYEFAREAVQRRWRWAAPLIADALCLPSLSDSVASLIAAALCELDPAHAPALCVRAALHAATEGAQLAALDSLIVCGDDRALRALTAGSPSRPLTARVSARWALTIAALQRRADSSALGALSLVADDDATGALTAVEHGALELLPAADANIDNLLAHELPSSPRGEP